MTGSDKIITRIREDAQAVASKKLDAAQEECKRILDQARLNAEKQQKAICAEGGARCEIKIRNARSSADLLIRNALLSARRNEIDKTLSAVAERIKSMDDAEYFAVIEKLVKKNAEKTDGGEMFMNERDLNRCPNDFAKKIKSQTGLTLSDTPCEIDGGFILRYGDIEINAEISAMIEEKRDGLEDLISSLLF